MKLNLVWAAGAAAMIAGCAVVDEPVRWSEEEPDAGVEVPPPADAGDPQPSLDGGADGAPGEDPFCGDGKVSDGEECDDGNDQDGDGCSTTCKIESAGPNDVCPGVPITLTGTGADPRTGSVSGTTAGLFGHTAGTCGGGNGKDAVYSVTADVTGWLTAKITSNFDSILYARRMCDDASTELACGDAPGAQGGDVVKVPITQGEPVFLFVDGYSASEGPFTLDVEVEAAFCGNGVAEPPETCDDGNTVAGDGCAPDCTLEGTPTDINTCPGYAVTLVGAGTADRTFSVRGSTASLPNSTLNAVGCSATGPNAVYAFTPDIDGLLIARLVPDYENAVLHLRAECDSSSTNLQYDCAVGPSPLVPIEVTAPARNGMATYVVVDSTNSTYKGTYALDVVVRPGVCGNEVLEGGEECDDGNLLNGDGCSDTCQLEPVTAEADVCPGKALPLVAVGDGSYTGRVTSSTAPLAHNYSSKTGTPNCSSIGVSARDAVYAVTSPIDGLLTATVKGQFDSMIYARSACLSNESASDLKCSNLTVGNGPETITVPIAKDKPIYVFVDGAASAAAGPFVLDVAVVPSVCGNGVLEGGEECDDRNTASGDGCSSTCKLEPVTGRNTCATAEPITLEPVPGTGSYSATVTSGTTNLTHTQSFSAVTNCAAGSGAGPDAFFTIVAPISGVLTAEIPVATFDATLGARTATTCPINTNATAPLLCSNVTSDDGLEQITFSVVKDELYYLIVDSPSLDKKGAFTLTVNVHPPGCGDSLLADTEECDDGNNIDGDGCSSTCTIETLPGIDACPGYALDLSGAGTDPRTGVVTVDTSALSSKYAGTCGGNAKEGVVMVTPPIHGKLTLKLTGSDYQPVLYVRTTCGDLATQKPAWCVANQPSPQSFSRDLTISGVTAGTPYYVFIDGYNGGAGKARLNVTVTP